MKMYLEAAIIITAGTLLVTGCGKQTAPENTIVTVGEEVITLDDLKREWQRYIEVSGQPEDIDVFLEDMIAEKLFINEAERLEIDEEERFQEEIENYREELMVKALLGKRVLAVNQPSEREMKEYFEKNREYFSVPVLTRYSHIVIKSEDGGDGEEMMATCADIITRLEAGEDFGDLAREFSEGSEAERGGDLGYFRPGQLVPQLEEAAADLEVGEFTGPIETDFGCHIISVTNKKPPRDKSFEESKPEVIEILLAQRRKANFDAFKDELKKRFPVTKNEQLLESIRREQQQSSYRSPTK